jgi:hypothetical protein
MLKIINFIQVRACNELGLTLEFVNTSAHSDSGCVLSGVGLKPDVCVYAKNSGRQRHADFSKMEISIEFKRETIQDAFVDPPSASNRNRHSFERDSDQGKDTRGQLIAYASAQMETQFRTFCFTVELCGSMARLIRWDHSGAVVTSAFDYGMNPDLLAQFFWRYSHMDSASRGYDLSVVDANEADAQRACTKLGVPISTRIFNVHVPNDALEFNGDPNLVNGYKERRGSPIPNYFAAAPTYRGRCLGGRFTRTFPIYDKTTNRILLLKDTWRVNRDDFEKEGQVYAALKAASVPYVAELIQAGDVLAHKTDTQNLVSKFACKLDDELMLPHRHYRLVLNTIGTLLWQFYSSFELVQAVWDAVEGL